MGLIDLDDETLSLVDAEVARTGESRDAVIARLVKAYTEQGATGRDG